MSTAKPLPPFGESVKRTKAIRDRHLMTKKKQSVAKCSLSYVVMQKKPSLGASVVFVRNRGLTFTTTAAEAVGRRTASSSYLQSPAHPRRVSVIRLAEQANLIVTGQRISRQLKVPLCWSVQQKTAEAEGRTGDIAHRQAKRRERAGQLERS